MYFRLPIVSQVSDYVFKHTSRIQMHRELALKRKKEKESPMLEDVVSQHPYASLAVAGAMVSLAYPVSLGIWSAYVNRGSPRLATEAQAHDHFAQLKDHYGIADDALELRIKYDAPTYIQLVEGKPVIFLNMAKDNDKASIQHEVLHYVHDDLSHDREDKSLVQSLALGAKYLFVMEPRVLWRLHKERID